MTNKSTLKLVKVEWHTFEVVGINLAQTEGHNLLLLNCRSVWTTYLVIVWYSQPLPHILLNCSPEKEMGLLEGRSKVEEGSYMISKAFLWIHWKD